MVIKSKSQEIQAFGMRALYWMLLFSWSPLLFCASAFGLPAPEIGTSDLNRQLMIRLNNGTQGERRDEADRLVLLGERQQRRGNLESAIASWLQALEIYHQIGDFEAFGLISDRLGLTYADLGLYREAEDALRRRLAIARTLKDRQGQIFGLNNVGTILLQKHRLPDAKATFEEALKIARDANNFRGEGLSLSNLGLVAAREKDYDRAIKLFEAAVSLQRRARDSFGEALTLNYLGDTYQAIHRYRESTGAYGEALRIAQVSGDRPNHFRAIDGLVAVYCTVGQYARAEELLRDRIALARQDENLRQELKSFQLLAGVYERWEKFSDAATAYLRALDAAHALGDRQTAAILLYQLGDILPAALAQY
jgi:tetratricopeptide (TPR) repeat protein